jgi:apolipoprotein D and lipocalin family protein
MHHPIMRRAARTALIATAAALGLGCAGPGPATAPGAGARPAAGAPAPLQPIARLDLPRYLGRWHELARYPNRFQRQCTGAATADYARRPGGTVQVINRCPQADGRVDEAIGEARLVGPEGAATLQVRFAPAWLGFLPQVWGDYWVVELDADYQLAVVSEPTREYLWVLSRQPSLPAADWPALTARLQALSFEPARLIRSTAP